MQEPINNGIEFSLTETAFHEAGHAIATWHFGFRIKHIKVFRGNINGIQCWCGESPTTGAGSQTTVDVKDHPDVPIQFAAISFAGCLAQTKFNASTKDQDAKLSPIKNWDELYAWMNSKDVEQLTAYPMAVESKSDKHHFEYAFPRSFGGNDRTIFFNCQRYCPDKEEFSRSFRAKIEELIQQFNSTSIWNELIRLATDLEASVNPNTDIGLLQDINGKYVEN